MEPNNNNSTPQPDSAPQTETTPEPVTFTPANPETSQPFSSISSSSASSQPQPKRKKPIPTIVLACTTVIFAGLATFFGYQYLTSGQSNSSQSNNTNETAQSISSPESPETEDIAYKNPVIKASNPNEHYSVSFTSAIFSSNGKEYTLDIGVENGEITTCTISTDIQNIGDHGTSKRQDRDCQIGGLSGKIYKIVEVGEGHEASGDIAVFIMEDGTAQYLKLQEAFDNMDFNIKGKINTDGFITDIFHIGVGSYDDNGEFLGAGGSTVFVFRDGTYLKYNPSSML